MGPGIVLELVLLVPVLIVLVLSTVQLAREHDVLKPIIQGDNRKSRSEILSFLIKLQSFASKFSLREAFKPESSSRSSYYRYK